MVSPYDSTHPSRPVLARKRTCEKASPEESTDDPASPSASLDDKGKTRARINMACIHCRHRKIKCDGAQPSCATCTRLRRECDYEAVSEYENLVSRERKRRNKEKKAARMASLGIFAGQSPLSMLHPSTSLGMPSTPLAHYAAGPSQPNVSPVFVSLPDQTIESQFGPRRRRGISEAEASSMYGFGPLSPIPDAAFQQASVSQPPTPAQTYRFYQSLASSPAQQHLIPHAPSFYQGGPLSAPLMPHATSGPFFAFAPPMTPTSAHCQPPPQMLPSPHLVDLSGLSSSTSMPLAPTSRASATEAEINLGLLDMADVPTMVPTSAHVRPIDLPAPHGHFDFASIPFPTQNAFALELPTAALRRRSSIHLPVGTADAFLRRPSVAEVATASLMQQVADRRAVKDVKELTDELLEDASGIVAWNAHVQSQIPSGMASWAGFQPQVDLPPSYPASTTDYVPFTVPGSRSNSDGFLTLGPLSPPATLPSSGFVKTEDEVTTSSQSVSSNSVDTVSLPPAPSSVFDQSCFNTVTPTPPSEFKRDVSPFALSPSSGMQSSLLSQDPWSQSSPPLLSPVSELNSTFHNFNVFQPNSEDKSSQDLSSSLAMAFTSHF